jgi:hypothetical protein
MVTVLLALGLKAGSQAAAAPPSIHVGDPVPDFPLHSLVRDEAFQLADNFHKRPTVLVFGSCT